MKKTIVFIDNDDEKIAKHDVDNYVKMQLGTFANVKDEFLNAMKIVPDFYRMERDDMLSLLYNKENVICTRSAFTSSHCNSKGQLIRFLSTAGLSDVKGLTYIELGSYLEKTLNFYLEESDSKNVMNIIRAIETNNIITPVEENYKMKFMRLRFDATGERYNCFRHEAIDLNELIEAEVDPQPLPRQRVRK